MRDACPIDQNGDGRISDGSELFDEHTVQGAPDGFSALVRLFQEEKGSPRIAQVDASHRLFSRLLLWTDINRDGKSQELELRPAAAVLCAIGLGMTVEDPANAASMYPYTGWARCADSSERPIYTVYLLALRK